MQEVEIYQQNAISRLLEFLPEGDKNILEIGSDLDCRVIDNLTGRYKGLIVGINPSEYFPQRSFSCSDFRYYAFRSDGCSLPFQDNSFDGIVSIATMEHVRDIEKFLSECYRVLRPGGVFYTKFSPIWSCGTGHHVYAVADRKEARFWKPGKNPLPDFSHLLWTPEEMREFLRTSPCDDRLIDPIISWVYFSDDINRLFLEDYKAVFKKYPFKLNYFNLIASAPPSDGILTSLKDKYGHEREFGYQGIEAVMTKEASASYLNKMGEDLYGKGDSRGAFNIFQRVIETDQSFAQAYNNLGVLLWESGEAENAVHYFQRALEIDPSDRNTLLNCGGIMTALGNTKDAERLYSSFLSNNPQDREIAQKLEELTGKKKAARNENTHIASPGTDKIEILSADIIEEYKNLADMVLDLGKKLNIGLGWHYLLDIVWIVLNIQNLPKGSVVLDAGAGNGLLQCVLAGLGYKVISVDYFPRQIPQSIRNNWNVIEADDGVDFDNEYIRQLKDHFAYRSNKDGKTSSGVNSEEFLNILHSAENIIVYYRADFSGMSLIKDNSVDCIVSLSALEHNEPESIRKAVGEFQRVLRPDGRMILTLSAAQERDWYHEQSKGWCFTEKTLADMFDLYAYHSNFHEYNSIFGKLRTGKGLKGNLAPVYFKSGNNGMPWGIWDPQYQPVGIVKHNTIALSRTDIIGKCRSLSNDFKEGKRFLHQIFLDVNNSCNLNCVMCSRDNRREPARNMTPEEFKIVADKCFRYANNLQISCAWEASISKHTPEILSLLPEYGIPFTSLLTNGNFMAGELAEAVFRSGLSRLIFSLEEADPEIYRKIRVNGDLARVIKNIETVSRLKREKGCRLPQLGVNMTIMNSNIDEMPRFVEFASSLGIEIITGRHLILLEDCGTGVEVLYKNMDHANAIIAEARELAKKHNIMFHVPFITGDIERKTLCTRPWDSLYIVSNGNVSCCPRISRTRVFGNLIRDEFEKLYCRNSIVKRLRKCFESGEYDNDICRWCVNGLETREAINQRF